MTPMKTLVLGTLMVFSTAHAYDVVERFKIIEDKFKTEDMLNPMGHDFFLDFGASLNKNLTDVLDDVDKASSFKGTDNEKLDEAKRVLTKYDKTEQTVRIKFGLGFPLPSFTAWDVKVKPNFRTNLNVGANIGIRSQKFNNQTLLDLFRDQIPAELQTLILGLSLSSIQGQDIRTICIADPGVQANPIALAYCNNLPVGKYVVPTNIDSEPTMTLLAKVDAKAGFFNDYTYGEHFFGHFNLYGMGRADLYQYVTGSQIAKGDSIDTPKEMNTEVTLQTDYRFGYKNSNYSAFASFEELKLAKMSDAKAGSKGHTYEYDPLLRLHADAMFRTDNLSIQPFAGVHKRAGYGFANGVYLGTSFGAHVWKDRLGLQLRGMIDKQYFTITPRMKLWLMQLEYSLKTPMSATDGDVKLTALHSVDFRIFF